MTHVTLPQDIIGRIPPEYAGRWRITIRFFINEDEVEKEDCNRLYADIYEV